MRPGINVSNYEMLRHFDPEHFAGVVLDESSILKAYMGKTKRRLIEAFERTPWKLCATATPSPNDHMELLNTAQFLGVMTSHEALAIWFINTDTAGKYRLKRHAEKDFWRWVSSWAVALSEPADLGYPNDGFELPELRIHEHVAETSAIEGARDGELFRIPELSATAYHREKKISAGPRADLVAEISAGIEGPCAIWCETNYEADEIVRRLPGAVEIRGNSKPAAKEAAAIDFADGKIDRLISKGSIFGHGMNFQVCSKTIFNGLSFSFEQYYQTVRRFWRYGQTKEVDVHIVMGDGEKDILATVRRKEADHETLKRSMVAAVREAQGSLRGRESAPRGYQPATASGEGWSLVNGDAVEEVSRVDDDSVGLIVFSPPFSSLYIYSDSERDMGNCRDDAEFFRHFDYLIPHLLRVLTPGRLCAVHCKNLVDYKGRDGRAGIRDFRGDIIRAMERHGFKFHSETTIWTDPVTEMQRTKAHGLLWKQLRKDSSYSRMGLADYLLGFRKWCPAEETDPEPVTHTKEDYPLEMWQRVASPVWTDINRMRVLNVSICRDDQDEKHLCPLQLDVIERVVALWSNPGDLVLSPFAGVGSEGVVALQMDRRFIGVELKSAYFDVARENLENATRQGDLFASPEEQEAYCDR